MFKIHQNLHRDSLKYKEQLSLLSQLRISPEFKVIILEQIQNWIFPDFLKGLNLFRKI
jgi:hypothetical protein